MTKSIAKDTNVLDTTYSIKPRVWIGFVAIAFSILLAAGLGNLIGIIFPEVSEVEEFAWSHFIPLPIAIIAGLWFVRKAGWTKQVFEATPSYKEKHRRRWLLIFPILLAAQAVISLATAPWASQSITFILISLFAMILVAINEELYFRGILRFTIEQHHGQTITLLVVSVLFGLAHTFGSLFDGLPLTFIAFQVGATAFLGVAYYAAFIATGRLWVPIAFHFVSDFTLRLSSGETSIGPMSSGDPAPLYVAIEMILIALVLPLLISVIKYDIRMRKDRGGETLTQ